MSKSLYRTLFAVVLVSTIGWTTGETRATFDAVARADGEISDAAEIDPYADSVVDYQVFGNNNTHTDPSLVLGQPCKGTNQDLSLGGGWVIVDMGEGEEIGDVEGNDLRVYESEGSPYCNGGAPSPYEVFVSNSPEGPWLSIGTGSGVSGFDLAKSEMDSARYVKVEDRSSGQPDNNSKTPGADIAGFEILAFPPEKSWTLMYYFGADNDLDATMKLEYNRLSNAGGNQAINIVAFFDGKTSPASYSVFTPDGLVGPFEQGELNTGSPDTLENFVTWAKTNYPGQDYALIVNDHGHGLSGVAQDDSSNKNYLTSKELKQALENTGKVDVLYMHACLMGNIEVAYELRGWADYYVAMESRGLAPIQHANYASEITPQTSAQELAVDMASAYYQERGRTISVVKMSEIENVAAKASAMGASIRDNWATSGIAIWNITDASMLQRFDEGNDVVDNDDRFADLYHFAMLVGSLNEPEITAAANDLMSALDAYVVYKQTWNKAFPNAYGVSVVLPRHRVCFYTSDWLDFAGEADWKCDWTSQRGQTVSQAGFDWGPMLAEMIDQFNPDGPEDLYPPDPVPLDVSIPVFLPVVSFEQ